MQQGIRHSIGIPLIRVVIFYKVFHTVRFIKNDIIFNFLQEVENDIVFYESYCVKDFVKDYNSYQGNAYGMANTLLQTAFLRPKIKSKKVDNLFFTGQLTVPGPGVPPSLISGKLAANLIVKSLTKNKIHETSLEKNS